MFSAVRGWRRWFEEGEGKGSERYYIRLRKGGWKKGGQVIYEILQSNWEGLWEYIKPWSTSHNSIHLLFSLVSLD